MTAKPQLQFNLTSLSDQGFPLRNDEVFQTLVQQATSGGDGAAYYLQQVQKFADFGAYLSSAQPTYVYEDGPNGSKQARATDGQTTMRINVALSLNAGDARVATEAEDTSPPVQGIATVALQAPAPEALDKIVNLGIALVELPVGIVASKALLDALFKPLVTKISQFVQQSIERWAKIELGDDIDGAGDAVTGAAEDAASDVAEDATEIVVDDVAADVVVDLAAAVPPLAVLGILIAVPMIVKALEKQFILHIEVNNRTSYDLGWTVAYMDQGTMTAQPKIDYIPKMARGTDPWGDVTDVAVVYQADYSSMNKTGFTGIGLVLHLTPRGARAGTDVAAVIRIPWLSKNVIWLGDVPSSPSWEAIYDKGAKASPSLTVQHGNSEFSTRISLNALEGNHDEYYCFVQIEAL